nr:hypothetical protein [Tanacetum cinerariifolium]
MTNKIIDEDIKILTNKIIDNAMSRIISKMDNLIKRIEQHLSGSDMDGVDGEKYVENGSKFKKIDESHETQVGVHWDEDSIMDVDQVGKEAGQSSDGMMDGEEDQKSHEIESMGVVDNIELGNLAENSTKRNKDKERSFKDSSNMWENQNSGLEENLII